MFKDKKKDKLSDLAQKAKMSVLQDIHGKAGEDMSDKLRGLKKVAVMSDSEEGLRDGLEKAKGILEAKKGVVSEHDEKDQSLPESMDDVMEPKEMPENEPSESEESDEEEMPEMSAHESMHDAMSEEDIDKKIAELHMLKHKKRMGK